MFSILCTVYSARISALPQATSVSPSPHWDRGRVRESRQGSCRASRQYSYSMEYVADCMRLIQARIPEPEYDLLRREAKRAGKSLQDVIREALRAHLLDDTVQPAEPLFKAFALFLSYAGRKSRLSVR